ncbi:MAG: alanine--tRNA ligase [Chloroflexi bacterium 44-23]|nr:MAG: alanine--tRNA ligase [Chloroflexi bacterium 44-23]
MENVPSGNQIRKEFIEFFIKRGHTYVPSSSLVPGGDATLLFTNAGMVQFKDVFLGIEKRPYTRAVNSQKCMRVAGKHNDLDDVGRDDWHHTFFEMLGNWSFGDYYKKDAIPWAWQLLTDFWHLDPSKLWVTVFKDEKGIIPSDEEAYQIWKEQPNLIEDHILFFGRKENFWEMAETGPCGPCSEIHIDRGIDFCDKKGVANHVCRVNGDCNRFLELWNNVFIQYNRINDEVLEPLPQTHVDTGMGFERIVSVLQNVNSNYKTDLLLPLIREVQLLTEDDDKRVSENFTPYRVIADHARAATFLIADGVVPGNTGRNYVCRMIIRRAARFAGKLGINDPFLARIAQVVINNYGEAYPELLKNQQTILENLTREEVRFARTLQSGLTYLDDFFASMQARGDNLISGDEAFDLYATHGLPFEITRDIARENNFEVDEAGFKKAMDRHRIDSGAGKIFGVMDAGDVEIYRAIFEDLQLQKLLPPSGVKYDPYSNTQISGRILALIKDGERVESVFEGDSVEIILPQTCFYVESGGQVSDTGVIRCNDGGDFEIEVEMVRKPAAGIIVHHGHIKRGSFSVNDEVIASVDRTRRKDIMRNHTATHLLHAELHKVLGNHARQAGSLVAPDRLRFDFTHPSPLSADELERIENGVNEAILEDLPLRIVEKPIAEAMSEGAMALFGEKYGEIVRTISIGNENVISYELCGGTHVDETGDIGSFVIISEGSTAAGIRRIEAITGREAYQYLHRQSQLVKTIEHQLNSSDDHLLERISSLQNELEAEKNESNRFRQLLVGQAFLNQLEDVERVSDFVVLAKLIPEADSDTLRSMTDRFRSRYKSGVVVLGSVQNNKPVLIVAVTEDLVSRGLNAGNIVKTLSEMLGGGGGGRPTLAQAGGKDAEKLPEAISLAISVITAQLKS